MRNGIVWIVVSLMILVFLSACAVEPAAPVMPETTEVRCSFVRLGEGETVTLVDPRDQLGHFVTIEPYDINEGYGYIKVTSNYNESPFDPDPTPEGIKIRPDGNYLVSSSYSNGLVWNSLLDKVNGANSVSVSYELLAIMIGEKVEIALVGHTVSTYLRPVDADLKYCQ